MEDEQIIDEQPEVKTEAVGEVEHESASVNESKVTKLMTIGSDDQLPGQNMTVSSVSLQTSTAPIQEAARIVKVLVKYPEKWKRPKHLNDGETYSVSPETANQFIKEGFATMVNEDKP